MSPSPIDPAAYSASGGASAEYNVLFLFGDEPRVTALGPSVDGMRALLNGALTRESVPVEHAVTAHSSSVTTNVTVTIGRYLHTAGSSENETHMPRETLHLLQVWKSYGYRTGLIGKFHRFECRDDDHRADVSSLLSVAVAAHGIVPPLADGLHPASRGMPLPVSLDGIVPDANVALSLEFATAGNP